MPRSSVNGERVSEVLPRVLIIDDERIVIDACTDILGDQPTEVASAADGISGLRLCEEFRPDLVLLDLKMPGLPGIDVLRRIREIDPSIVIVIITGYATIASAVDALKLGAYDFLTKPFTPDQLRLVTRRGLEKRSVALEMAALKREREALRENFAVIVAHELKSPLSAVMQNLYVLSRQLDELVSEEQRDRLERMKDRIGGLVGTVDVWLQSVSVDLDRIRDRFQPIPAIEPINRAVENVRIQAVRKGVEIEVSVPEPIPAVFGDGPTLTEAFTNIIGNAVKYSHTGGSVTISATIRDGAVAVDISDTGIGIAEEDQSRLFDDFFRGASGGGGEGGIGLGLAVARRIAHVHSGSVEVESEPGRGSTFTVRLPIAGETGSDSEKANDDSREEGSR